MVVGAGAMIASAALAFVASVPDPIPYLPALRMQLASTFVSRIAPANTGTLAVGVRFLQRSGIEPGPAAAAVGLCARAGFAVHLSLMGGFLLWVGSSGLRFELPDASVVFAAVAIVLSASGWSSARPRRVAPVLPPLVEQVRTGVDAGRRAHRPHAGHRPARRVDGDHLGSSSA